MLMSTMFSLNISISISLRRKLMPMSRLSSLAHKLLMLMFMLMLASLVTTELTCFPPVLFFNEISTFYIQVISLRRNAINAEGDKVLIAIFPLLKEKKICESPRSDPNVNTASDEG